MASLSSPVHVTTTFTSRKRKSSGVDPAPAPAPKKPRARKVKVHPYATAKGHVDAILGPTDSFSLPENPQDTLEILKATAQYAKRLEGSVAVANVERLKTIINRGVTKQMSWKPSCKEGGARFAFDGLCADPRVFGALLALGGPPKWKAKNFDRDEFEGFVGKRPNYSTLKLMTDINIRYNPETGEFKVSGTYGDRDAWELRMRGAAEATARAPSLPHPHPKGWVIPGAIGWATPVPPSPSEYSFDLVD
ncbi:hypothetical protein B0J17DRAFT_719189 [Rhizoctonia solani]|nr:hypothetical protein B0J17DRAFT_719189 [Rhizoctonia solani]